MGAKRGAEKDGLGVKGNVGLPEAGVSLAGVGLGFQVLVRC